MTWNEVPQMNSLSWKSMTALFALSVALCGCGRATKIYPDGSGTLGVLPIQIDDPIVLPIGFYDQSVNHARVDLGLDGVTPTSIALRLQTNATSNSVGGFNGPGTGNRALLGVAEHNGTPLSALGAIGFDAKSVNGTDGVSILVQADLECDGSQLHVLEATSTALQPGANIGNGYVRYQASLNQSVWKSAAAAIFHPGNPSVTLVPDQSAATPVSLSALLSQFPAACLKNGATGNAGLPKNVPTAAVIFALGTPSTMTYNTVLINRLVIGSDVYEELNWSQP
jgi:hypothetical protein